MQRQMAWRILAAYLAVTAPAAVRAPVGVTALHVALLAAAAVLGWVRSPGTGAGAKWLAWAPLVAMALLYAELPALMAGAAGGSSAVTYHDALVQRWETQLFGISPAITLASQLPAWLSAVLHGAYLSYYALIFVPPLLLFVRSSEQAAFRATILALTAAFAVCFVVFVYFPVEGPRYAWPPPPGIPDGLVRRLALRVLASGSSRGAAFPSSHVAVSVTQVVLALKYQRRVGIPLAVCAALLALGAVYGGFHYGVDVLAGAALGLFVSGASLLYARGPRTLLSMYDVPEAALADAGQAAAD